MSEKTVDKNSVSISIRNPLHQKEEIHGSCEVRILCWNISQFSSFQQGLLCSIGIFICYIPYGYLLELLYKTDKFKEHDSFLTLYQFLITTVLASLQNLFSAKMSNRPAERAPFGLLFFLASLTVATMGLSNTAVGYLNYPTQVIFKSCKLIPVMIGGIIIQGKKYGIMDFISVLLLSIGLILFMLADKSVSPEFNPTGVVLISLALVADAMIGNTQEKVMKTYGTSNTNMIFYAYGIGSVYILLGCLVTGKLFPAIQFYFQHPVVTFGYGFIFSVCGYVGMQMVLAMILSCGALATVTLTTCRKAVTIILSFLLISKPFTYQYMWSGAIVFLGIFLNIYIKNRSKLSDVMKKAASLIKSYAKSHNFSKKHLINV